MAQITIDNRNGSRPRPRLARSRSRFGLPLGFEIALLATGLLSYRMVRTWVKDEVGEARENAARVVDWERAIGIFTEVDLQSTVLGNDAVVWMLNRYYFFGHFLGTALVLGFVFVFRHDHYGRIRRVLFTVTLAGLVLHVLFPLAPPRWFPEHGFVDTLQTYGPKIYDSDTVASAANQIAAMPSLHVGWAIICGWALVTALTSPWRWLALLHPIITTLAVVLTANHWWLDALAAMALVFAAVLADRPIQGWLERRAERRAASSARPEPSAAVDTLVA
jgi:hypothetical protein